MRRGNTKVVNHYPFNFNLGFTFIELLIVMLIMTVLFGLGYANYRGFQRRQYLESAVRMIKTDLKLAQESALSARVPPGSACANPGAVLLNYSFVIIDTNGDGLRDRYQVWANCTDLPNFMVKEVNLTAGVQMSAFSPVVTPADTIQFLPLGRGTNLTSGSSTVTTITFTGIPSRTVRIRSSGTVE